MSSRLKRQESVSQGLERLLRRELAAAIDALHDAGETPEERVHIARRRLKRARSFLVALAPAVGRRAERERRRIRDAARLLSATRDADVAVETARALVLHAGPEAEAPLERLVAGLAARATDGRNSHLPLDDATRTLARTAAAIDDFRVRGGDGDEELLIDALGDAYRDGRRAMARALRHPEAENVHAWRKLVKHRSHLTRAAGKRLAVATPAVGAALDRLGDVLGDANDLAVLEAMVAQEPGLAGTPTEAAAVIALIAGRREVLKGQGFALGEALFGVAPRRFRAALAARTELLVPPAPSAPAPMLGGGAMGLLSGRPPRESEE
ncbi:CHAD domain-containing protein [Pseudoxanthobacter sp.]|uniref:CHAD domain-containing protein n=1 Tax=Pseudoxanthobacter sp. TaxID=1925742 RepID=UPI002FE31D17